MYRIGNRPPWNNRRYPRPGPLYGGTGSGLYLATETFDIITTESGEYLMLEI